MNQEPMESSAEDLMAPVTKDVNSLELEIASADPAHFHQIKMLLGTFFKSDLYREYQFEMADQLSQLAESTDVLLSELQEVVGFASFVPLRLFCDKKFVELFLKQIAKLTDEKFIAEHNVALLFNHKYMNLPTSISLDLYDSLLQDLQWTQSKDYNDAVYPREFFNVDYFVLMSKCKADKNERADLETLYDLQFYELKDVAQKVLVQAKDCFDAEYPFNVFLLVKKEKLAEFVRKYK